MIRREIENDADLPAFIFYHQSHPAPDKIEEAALELERKFK
ncbi:MAG TPA: hypothetical protein VF598_14320 [Hymenobacter sp.]